VPIDESQFEYVGFWSRVFASLVDTVLLCVLLYPLLTLIYGRGYWTDPRLVQGPLDVLLQWVLPAVAIVIFWPELVTSFLDAGPAIDPSQIEIDIPATGEDGAPLQIDIQ